MAHPNIKQPEHKAQAAPKTAQAVHKQPEVKQPTTRPDKRLTGKQQAFIQEIVENPLQPAYKAAQKVYGKGKLVDDNTARAIASENLTKPNILMELSKYSETAENTLIEVMKYSKEYGKQGNTAGANYASTAAGIANSVLDRLHGKATQRIEQQSTSVTLNIDLSSTS